MCPQKWKASASPASTSAPTAPAPAASDSSLEKRARKPRRDVEVARPSAIAPRSGMRLGEAALGRREDALELAVRVERPLRVHPPVAVEGDGERAPRDSQRAPDVGVAHFVEDLDGDERVAPEGRDHRLQALTESASLRGEDGECELGAPATVEALGERDAFAERRPLVRDVERRLRSEPKTKHSELAREREHGDRQGGDACERGHETEQQPAVST